MSHNDKPELHVIRFPEGDGAERERVRAEARQRYVDHLAAALPHIDTLDSPVARAAALIDALTAWNDVTAGDRCGCGCHPSLPDGDLHDFGFACPCQMTPDVRSRQWDDLIADMDEFWESPEGKEITDAAEAEDQALEAWLAAHPDVEVRFRGGWAPEQWRGSVDGHSFYFRERQDHWRIEVDLCPTGRFSTVWVGGDFDETNFEQRELDAGDVIAEGTTTTAGYGTSPVERLQFIVRVIRDHLRRRTCTLHTDEAAARIEAFLGRSISWCPACGEELRNRAS